MLNKNKRGVLGEFMTLFVVTILILGILFAFIYFSGIIKKVEGKDGGTVSELKLSESGVVGYEVAFNVLVQQRVQNFMGGRYEK